MKKACKHMVLFTKYLNRHVKCPTPHYSISGGKPKIERGESGTN